MSAPTAVTEHGAPVVIAGRMMTVEVITSTFDIGNGPQQSTSTYLIGARGARYLCRPFLGDDDGVREVISMGSGAPLRDKCQRPVRVLVLGDVVEEIAR